MYEYNETRHTLRKLLWSAQIFSRSFISKSFKDPFILSTQQESWSPGAKIPFTDSQCIFAIFYGTIKPEILSRKKLKIFHFKWNFGVKKWGLGTLPSLGLGLYFGLVWIGIGKVVVLDTWWMPEKVWNCQLCSINFYEELVLYRGINQYTTLILGLFS